MENTIISNALINLTMSIFLSISGKGLIQYFNLHNLNQNFIYKSYISVMVSDICYYRLYHLSKLRLT